MTDPLSPVDDIELQWMMERAFSLDRIEVHPTNAYLDS